MLLVGNGFVITGDEAAPCIANGCVAIEKDQIVETGACAPIRAKYPGAVFIDAGGKVIMPGLINTHMHLYSTFARGMALKDDPPGNFTEILERLWWRLDKVLTAEDIYYSALVAMTDCIKAGTTTIFDHHASPWAVRESLYTIAKAARLVGIRSCLCYEVSDRDGAEATGQGIRENVQFIKYCNNAEDDMLKAMFGLHASLTLSDHTLARCVEAADGMGTGFHVHTAEGLQDVADSLRQYGKRVVTRFHDFGILGPKTIAAHCVHIDDDEINLLQDTRTKVVHNPESNMGNAVGYAPVGSLLRRGVTVGLGTDGYTADMFESLKVANILQKHQTVDPQAGWAEAPAMLWANNSSICAEHFKRPLGKLVAGAHADVIIVSYDPPTPLNEGNINGHMIFGLSGGLVDTTIVNGEVLMRGREMLAVDEGEMLAKSRELAAKLWQRF